MGKKPKLQLSTPVRSYKRIALLSWPFPSPDLYQPTTTTTTPPTLSLYTHNMRRRSLFLALAASLSTQGICFTPPRLFSAYPRVQQRQPCRQAPHFHGREVAPAAASRWGRHYGARGSDRRCNRRDGGVARRGSSMDDSDDAPPAADDDMYASLRKRLEELEKSAPAAAAAASMPSPPQIELDREKDERAERLLAK